MEGCMSQGMPGFRVTFILPSHCNDESEVSKIMFEAYEKSKIYLRSELRWVREEKLNIKELTKKDYIIFDDIASGRSFEEFVGSKCIILGPWALCVCLLEGKAIPNYPWPIHNIACHGCVITCSNISKPDKSEIKKKVELMGGCYEDGLVATTTHLVTNTVTTNKYITAAQSGKKIMLPSWIDTVWEDSLQGKVHADDATYMKYRCLPFHALNISSTGIGTKQERQKLVDAVISNGGEFTPSLKLTSTNILVCHGTLGTTSEKYKAARKTNSIQCVTLEWVYDSIKNGYALPVDQYKVKASTSTPVKEGENCNLDFSTISAIGGNTLVNQSAINETANLTSLASTTVTPSTANKSKKRKAEYTQLLEGIDFKKIKRSGHFLEHCCICVVGFDEDDREKLNKAISLSGATRYNSVSESVTHVIVGDASCAEAKQILSKNYQCSVVNIQWFLESMVRQQPVKEDNYLVKSADVGASGMGSPLSKKGLSLLRTNKTVIQELDAGSTRNCDMPGTETLAALLDDESDFTNQNHENIISDRCTDRYHERNDDATTEDKDVTKTNENVPANQEESRQESLTQDTCTVTQDSQGSHLFNGLKFSLLDLTNEVYIDFKETIESLGGTVVSRTFKGIPDYAIVSIFPSSAINPTAQETVNEMWLRECVEGSCLLDIDYYHRPFVLKETQPLQDCVVTISGYSNKERVFLKNLVVALGGLDQDSFARVTNEAKGIVACTHLVSLEASGKKYQAAKKWKIPVVTKYWLLECAKTGEYAPEENFITKQGVDVLEDTTNIAIPTSKSSSKVKAHESPVREPISNTSKVVTPPVNRRLAFNKTVDSGEGDNGQKESTLKNDVTGKCDESPLKHSTKVLTPVNRIQEVDESSSNHTAANTKVLTPVNSVQAVAETSSYHTTGSTKVLTPVNRRQPVDESTDSPKTPANQVYKFKAIDSPISSQITPVSKILQEAREKKLLDSVAESPQNNYYPWNMKTPETPYGACIMPNPSRELRKQMLSFINQIPDFSPPKKRLSTPLSEIKRQIRMKIVAQSTQSQAAAYDKDEETTAESEENVTNDVFQSADDDDDGKETSSKAVDNVIIDNKLQQLDDMLTAQGTSSNSKRASKSFHRLAKPQTATSQVLSQVCTVGWDFKEDEPHDNMYNPNTPKVFLLSGISESVRVALDSQIQSLGATVSHAQHYDPACTHLLCARTTRNEKTLACMAGGRWILHINYVEMSYRAGKFLEEEEFEFGNPKSAKNIPKDYTDADTESRNRNAFWWRQKICKRGYGAFNHMRAIIVAKKADPLRRVIEAGGGVVVNVRPPFDDTVHATHCLIEPKSMPDSDYAHYAPLAQQGVLCVSTLYISDFLQRKEDADISAILPQFSSFYEKQ